MSVNDKILDEITGHSVDLQRLEASVKADVRKQLKRLEKTLVADIQNSNMVDAVREQTKIKRMKALLKQTRETIKTTYKQVAKTHAKTLANVASIAESQAVSALNKSINFKVASVGMSKQMLKAIASDTLFEGAQSAEWWSRRSEAFHARFSDTIRQGMMRGDSTSLITKNLIGTSPNKFKDGALQANRRSAEALVRTSIQAVANESRLMTYADNDDVIKSIEWVSTLDSRTSNTCKGLDGLTWSNPERKPINHSVNFPGVTAHWGCRSTQVPITKSWEELGAKGDFDEIPESTRASMDGQVSDKLGYEGWLKGKSEKFQRDALGANKFDLWKKGNMKFTDLVNQSGNPLTVEQLSTKLAIPKKVVVPIIPNPVLGFDSQFDEMMTDITDEAKEIINMYPLPSSVTGKLKGGWYRARTMEMSVPLRGRTTEASRRTLLHEYGHHLDNVFLNKDKKISNYLSTYKLDTASARDARALGIGKGMRGQTEKMEGLVKELTTTIKRDYYRDKLEMTHGIYGNISDIIDSMTRGQFRSKFGMPGHGKSYYLEGGTRSQMAENFANLFLLWSDKKHWEYTMKLFPDLTKDFLKIMDDALEGKLQLEKVSSDFVKRDFSHLFNNTLDDITLSPSTVKAIDKAKNNVEEVIDKARVDFVDEWKVYHGGDTKFVAKLRKTNTFTVKSGAQKESGTGGNRFGLSTSKDFSMSKDFSTSATGSGDVVELYIHPDARVLRLKNKTLDDLSEADTKRLKKEYDVIIDEDNVGGEMEWRLLNPDVLRTEKQLNGYFDLYKENALRAELTGDVAKKVVKKVEAKIQTGLGLLDRIKLRDLKAKANEEVLSLLEQEQMKRLEQKLADIVKKAKEEIG